MCVWEREGERLRTEQTFIYQSFIGRALFPETQSETKAKWDREGGWTKARRPVTWLTTASQKAQPTALSNGAPERPHTAPQNRPLWVEKLKPFVCWFFPASYLSTFGPMEHYRPWTFFLCSRMALGSSWWLLLVKSFLAGGSEDGRDSVTAGIKWAIYF